MLSHLLKSLAAPRPWGLLLLALLALPDPLCLDIARRAEPNQEPSQAVRLQLVSSAELTKPALPLSGENQGFPIIHALSALAKDCAGIVLTSREHLYQMAHNVRFKEESSPGPYRWRIVACIALFIIQAALIGGLLVNRARRRYAEDESHTFERSAEDHRKKLAEVISSVPGIVWEAKADRRNGAGKMAFVSDYARLMLGYSVDEWLSTPGFWLSIVLAEDREQVRADIHRALSGARRAVTQFRWLAKDGTVLWAEAHLVPILNQKGETLGLRGVTIDITDRKRAEMALKENQALLQSLVGPATDAIISVDDQQHIILFNAAAERMFGCSAQEAIGQSIDRFIPERFLAAHRTHIEEFGVSDVAARSVDGRGPIYGRRADGTEFPIQASISHIELNGRTAYAVILRDITTGKRAEAQLIELETRFRKLADSAPVMIWVSDRNKLCTYFNKQWLDFTGRSLEQELGNGWTAGVHPDDHEVCLQTYASAFDRREPFKMEYRLRRADGEFGWVYDSGSPRFSTTGKFLGYIGSCIDITERKAAEQALMDLSGQLIRAREDECARIARDLHDNLHQRVALVSLELDQLIHKPPESESKLRESVLGILKQTAELSAEIHSMSHDLHPSKLVLLGLVPALKSLCVELSHSYGLKIEFKHADVPSVLPKEILLCLYRVVQESLNNVVRHSGATEARVELQGTEQWIRLRVSDSGRGFDVESARSRKGLGLISMRERLRLINGRISIDSRISGGTRIDVAVPLPQMGVDGEKLVHDDRTQAVASGLS